MLLGNPSKTYVKEEKGARRASKGPQQWTGESAPDYFYNYFPLGMDVMVDGLTKAVKKIILHTNQPLHPLFGLYERCFFEMKLDVG